MIGVQGYVDQGRITKLGFVVSTTDEALCFVEVVETFLVEDVEEEEE